MSKKTYKRFKIELTPEESSFFALMLGTGAGAMMENTEDTKEKAKILAFGARVVSSLEEFQR